MFFYPGFLLLCMLFLPQPSICWRARHLGILCLGMVVPLHPLHLGDGINALNGCLLKEIAPPLLRVHSCLLGSLSVSDTFFVLHKWQKCLPNNEFEWPNTRLEKLLRIWMLFCWIVKLHGYSVKSNDATVLLPRHKTKSNDHFLQQSISREIKWRNGFVCSFAEIDPKKPIVIIPPQTYLDYNISILTNL